ncbi:MAG: tetraacyldisaccharide 4'-kinase [Sedimentisphaerales bacterium]|nr:tetraacyldisaccharide 4'-kinase [Sedimentisphaerales bacterium]
MNQRDWYNLVSGGRAGLPATVLRLLLGVAACAYAVVIRIRNLFYDEGLFKSYAVMPAGLITSDRAQAAIPIISIGNITTGGTGKTPMVIWLVNFLQAKGVKCAVLTRGYKSAKGQYDEPAILAKSCPGVAVVVNPDRLKGAIEAVRRHRAQVLIMDDGFQHRRLHRDIDIVTIDATQPFGFGKMLPAGLLREPVSSLKRATAVVITRSDQASENNLTEIIKQINPNVATAKAIHSPICVIWAGDKKIPLEQLRSKPVFAFCGIANPEAFFATVASQKAKIVGSKIYNDHHNYTAKDTDEIFQIAAQAGAEMILTTEKDYDKIDPSAAGRKGLILAYLAVRLRFIEGENGISGLIERTITGKIPEKRTG